MWHISNAWAVKAGWLPTAHLPSVNLVSPERSQVRQIEVLSYKICTLLTIPLLVGSRKDSWGIRWFENLTIYYIFRQLVMWSLGLNCLSVICLNLLRYQTCKFVTSNLDDCLPKEVKKLLFKKAQTPAFLGRLLHDLKDPIFCWNLIM